MGTVNEGLFSSTVFDWATPKELFATLDNEFRFTLDPCATPETAKCDRFFTETDDGLVQRWSGVVFMNPPYGRTIGQWVAKAYAEAQRGAVVVALIPARTDTAYWHDFVMHAAEIRFIRGRLHFGGLHERTAHNAPFPSAVVVFRRGDRFPVVSSIRRPSVGDSRD